MTKPSAEYTAFDNLVSRVLSVPREELKRREAEYQRERQARPVSPKSVSEQIKAYMLEARLSKGEVANALGVDPRTVARHRSGTAIPRLDQVHGYEQLFSKRLNRPVRLEMP